MVDFGDRFTRLLEQLGLAREEDAIAIGLCPVFDLIAGVTVEQYNSGTSTSCQDQRQQALLRVNLLCEKLHPCFFAIKHPPAKLAVNFLRTLFLEQIYVLQLILSPH